MKTSLRANDAGSFDPITLIVNTSTAAKVWMGLTFAFAVGCIIGPPLTIRALREKERVIILDGSATLIYSTALEFRSAKELHSQLTRWAVGALFQRNPLGPDDPTLLDRIFIEPARTQAKQLIAGTAQAFKDRHIYQKATLTRLTTVDSPAIDGRESITVYAEGQLIKNGFDKDVPFTEAAPFEVKFVFVRNPDLLANNVLPMAVFSMEVRETAQATTNPNPQ